MSKVFRLFTVGLVAYAILPSCVAQIGGPPGSKPSAQPSLSTLQQIPQPDRILLHPNLSITVPLTGHLAAWVTVANRLGPVPDATDLHLTFVLTRAPQVQTAFEQLLADQQRPASPRFHQWLTPQQVGLLFGPTQNDIDALTAWLTSRGIRVGELAPSRIFLQAAAPASTVGAALSTTFNYYTVEGAPHLAAAGEPVLPAAFALLVSAIDGINDVPLHPMHTSSIIPLPAVDVLHPQFTSSTGTHYITPGDFATVYDLNPSFRAGYTGLGEKVAIVGRSRVLASDITNFQTNVGLAPKLPNIIVPPNGIDPGLTGDGNQDEATLDVDRVLSTAPDVQADLVISSNSGGGIVTAAQYEVGILNDPIMTISFGACERNAGQANVNFWDNLFATASAQGISVFVASGDSSAASCDRPFVAPPSVQSLSINYICASSYATCVGGTEFADFASPASYWSTGNASGRVSALSYIPEGVWNEPSSTDRITGLTSYVVQGAGGGASLYITKPSWQTGVGVPADGFRDVPDVSLPSSSHDGYYACLTYAGADCTAFFISFAGTSAAAPAMAGIAALLDQRVGKPQGNLNPLFYDLAATPANNVFHDATPASSGVATCLLTVPSMCNSSTVGLSAGVGTLTGGLAGYALTTGYDLATGWGSLDVTNFLSRAAAQISLIGTAGTLTASPATIKSNQAVTFTATIAALNGGTPTGSVQFASNGSALASPVPLVNGVATSPAIAFPTAGTYSISATYSGDTIFSPVSTPTLWLVVAPAGTTPATVTLTATATSVTATQAVSFTTTVSGTGGTPNGTVQFAMDGVNSGAAITLVNSLASSTPAPLPAGNHTIVAMYSGDNTFAPSISNSLTVIVTSSLVPSSTRITVNPTTITISGTSLVGALVTGPTGSTTPTGSVTLKFGMRTVSSLLLTNGTVVGTLGGLAIGTYPLFMTYSGDSLYAPSVSDTTDLIVTGGPGDSYSFVVANSSITVPVGANAGNTNILRVSSTSGYAGSFAISCLVTFNGTANASSVLPVCTPSPATLTLSSNVPFAASTLTITTTSPHAIVGGRVVGLRTFGRATLCGILCLCIPAVRRRRLWSVLASALFLTTALSGISGCGSGGRFLRPSWERQAAHIQLPSSATPATSHRPPLSSHSMSSRIQLAADFNGISIRTPAQLSWPA